MRLNINDVGFLHELRDAVLTGTLEETLSHTPIRMRTQRRKVNVDVSIDHSQFAAVYEGSVLSMDSLTPHQLEKMKECLDADYVHLQAPAGAGKTFVALNRLLELLYEEREARALMPRTCLTSTSGAGDMRRINWTGESGADERPA